MSANVLLVLEDGDLRSRLIQELGRCGCQVLPVRSAHSALIVLRQFPGTLDLLLTAEDLAGMSGSQLGRIACREREALRVILLNEGMEQVLQQVQAVLSVSAHTGTTATSYPITR